MDGWRDGRTDSITNEEFRDVSVTTKYHTLRFDTVDSQIILRKPGDQSVKVLVERDFQGDDVTIRCINCGIISIETQR